jgi:hypothetical protein
MHSTIFTMLHSTQTAFYSFHCVTFNTNCTLQFSLYSIQHKLHSTVFSMFHSTQTALYSFHYVTFNTNCTLQFSLCYIQHKLHSTVFTVLHSTQTALYSFQYVPFNTNCTLQPQKCPVWMLYRNPWPRARLELSVSAPVLYIKRHKEERSTVTSRSVAAPHHTITEALQKLWLESKELSRPCFVLVQSRKRDANCSASVP